MPKNLPRWRRLSSKRPRLGETMEREQALKSLRAMLDETIQARRMVENGQTVPVLKALARAKRLGKGAIAVLLSDCLKATTEQADAANLSRLAELIGFAMQALCPACRSEVGKKWKEAEDV